MKRDDFQPFLFNIGVAGMQIFGPFPINFNDPNIATGQQIYKVPPGQIVYDVLLDTIINFTGTGGFTTATAILKSNGAAVSGILGAGEGVTSGAGDANQRKIMLSNIPGSGEGGGQIIAISTGAGVTLTLQITPDAGVMTAGKVNVYVVVQ